MCSLYIHLHWSLPTYLPLYLSTSLPPYPFHCFTIVLKDYLWQCWMVTKVMQGVHTCIYTVSITSRTCMSVSEMDTRREVKVTVLPELRPLSGSKSTWGDTQNYVHVHSLECSHILECDMFITHISPCTSTEDIHSALGPGVDTYAFLIAFHMQM